MNDLTTILCLGIFLLVIILAWFTHRERMYQYRLKSEATQRDAEYLRNKRSKQDAENEQNKH